MDLWLLVLFLVVVQPILGYYRFRRLAGGRDVLPTRRKLVIYATIVVTEWILVGVCALVLHRRELEIADLGLGQPGIETLLLGAMAAAAFSYATVVNARRFARTEWDSVPSHVRKVARILPANGIESLGFVPVALTAGFCEEVLFRGFLFFAFHQIMPSVFLALAATSVVFGFAHSYQGPRGVVTTGILGGLLAALYWYSGSLWPGIALHAIIDLASGIALGRLPRPGVGAAQPPDREAAGAPLESEASTR